MGSVEPWDWKLAPQLCSACTAAGATTKPLGGRRCKCGISQWRARWRDPAGKSQGLVVPRKLDGERLVAKIETDKLAGLYIDPKAGRITVGELGVQLVDSKQDPNTKAWNQAMLNHVNARWERLPVGSVDFLAAQAWVTSMTAAGAGPDTVRGSFKVFHAIVRYALRARRIGFDPCVGVELPPINRRKMLFLTPAQVVLLAAAIERSWPGYGWGLLVKYGAYSGCRPGECGGLLVKHLDLANCRVWVTQARKTYGKDGDTKTRRSRWVDLPAQLCAELAEWIAEQGLGPEDRVWRGERGGPLNHKWFYNTRYKPTVIALTDEGLLPVTEVEVPGRAEPKVRTLRFQDLRHTCVALLIGKGAQQYEVMEHLGHADIQTTINTYGHLFPNVRVRIRVALEETWNEGLEAAA